MLCDDAVDLLEIGKDHIADDAVLDGCHGVAVLQHFLTVVMSQVTVESAGDVGVTASDPVDHIDAVVRRFTVVAVFLRRVDDGGKVVLLRSDDSALSRGNHGDRIFFTEGLLDLLNRAGLAEGQPGSVGGAEKDVDLRKDGFDAFSCLLAAPEVCAVVDIEGDQGAVLLELADTFDRELLCVAAES